MNETAQRIRENTRLVQEIIRERDVLRDEVERQKELREQDSIRNDIAWQTMRGERDAALAAAHRSGASKTFVLEGVVENMYGDGGHVFARHLVPDRPVEWQTPLYAECSSLRVPVDQAFLDDIYLTLPREGDGTRVRITVEVIA